MSTRPALLLSLLALPALAEIPRPDRPDTLADRLAPLQYFVGDWEIEATWSSGQALHARNEFRVGLAGRFLEAVTTVQDGGGPVYERYKTVYAATADGLVAHGFTFDGSVTSVPVQLEAGATLKLRTEMEQGGTVIRNDAIRIDDDAYAWKVWMKGVDDEDWTQLMDGVWKRVGPPAVRPIDTALFDASGIDVRSFAKTMTIPARPDEVFAMWATGDGWSSVYPAPSKADIQLAIGGRYHWLFDGKTGSNGCQVLSYVPNRMISFTWNAPPSQKTRDRRTWVVVDLRPTDGGTHVVLNHLGFGQGPEWDETYAYFDAAWERVLAGMAEAAKKKGAENPGAPGEQETEAP